MKKVVWVVVVVIVAFIAFKFINKEKEPPRDKPQGIEVSAHSEDFNKSVSDLLNSYYAMTEAFVSWDSIEVNKAALLVQAAISNLKTDELKQDSVIYETALFPLENSKSNITAILESSDWTAKRHGLQDLSENLRSLLITIQYDQGVVYWQECPMAFGEGASGSWLSNAEKIINPYLGKKDPKYGETMLNCGEIKETIDFTAAPAAEK